MTWDCETDSEFQQTLDGMEGFVRSEVEPLIFADVRPSDVKNPKYEKLVGPFLQQLWDHDLWAYRLGPELGGKGSGQV